MRILYDWRDKPYNNRDLIWRCTTPQSCWITMDPHRYRWCARHVTAVVMCGRYVPVQCAWWVVFLTACRCNPFGTIRDDCDQMTGRCVCRSHVVGNKCDVCGDGVTPVLSRDDCSRSSSSGSNSFISASTTATSLEYGMCWNMTDYNDYNECKQLNTTTLIGNLLAPFFH